jgi:TonB family protein
MLHGVAVAGVLLLQGDVVSSAEGVGVALDIHLVSSNKVADNHETELFTRQYHIEQPVEKRKKNNQEVLVVENSRQDILLSDAIQEDAADELVIVEPIQLEQKKELTQSIAQPEQATNASQQQHSIVELLHSRISDKKEYPYIARRQRREGTATVAFVLHPNGKIENAHLVTSSRTHALDRAALSAVQDIEPFSVAQDYLKQSEKFQVDVAFNLL